MKFPCKNIDVNIVKTGTRDGNKFNEVGVNPHLFIKFSGLAVIIKTHK
jgi:hypothetical protein